MTTKPSKTAKPLNQIQPAADYDNSYRRIFAGLVRQIVTAGPRPSITAVWGFVG